MCESRSNYYIVKTLNQKKPSVAILPKCLATSFGIALPFDQKDFSFDAITISKDGEFPLVCAKPELISLKEEFTFSDTGRSFVGIVEKVSSKLGVTLRFSGGLTKVIAMKDVPQADKVAQNFSLGKVVRAAVNSKTGRLSLKRSVVESTDSAAVKRDQLSMIQAFDKLSAYAINSSDNSLKIAQKVTGKVQLVKDYGLIVEIVDSDMTGFIVNEQKRKADKTYKVGDTLTDCVVLDIDFEKRIVDLSERLTTPAEQEESKSAAKKALKKS